MYLRHKIKRYLIYFHDFGDFRVCSLSSCTQIRETWGRTQFVYVVALQANHYTLVLVSLSTW